MLESECYKRPKGHPGALLQDWYNSKTFSLICERSHDALLFSPDLARELIEGFTALMPMYLYFSSLDGDPEPGEGGRASTGQASHQDLHKI